MILEMLLCSYLYGASYLYYVVLMVMFRHAKIFTDPPPPPGLGIWLTLLKKSRSATGEDVIKILDAWIKLA
jgi:hypothetical protein